MCLVVALVAAGAAHAGDGETAMYTTRGTAYDLDLRNTGTTRWLSFMLVGAGGHRVHRRLGRDGASSAYVRSVGRVRAVVTATFADGTKLRSVSRIV